MKKIQRKKKNSFSLTVYSKWSKENNDPLAIQI